MKKMIVFLLSAAMCFSFAACGGDNIIDDTPQITERTSQQTESDLTVQIESDSLLIESIDTEIPTLSKDEMLGSSTPLTRENLNKSYGNIPFAKSLIGNTYTFEGEIYSVVEDHAVITFYIRDDEGTYSIHPSLMVGNLYFPLEDLISFEKGQHLSLVGVLDGVETVDRDSRTVVEMVFQNAAVVSDRFENTGILRSPNASFGKNAWNIKFPHSDYLGVVYFREDVSAFEGKEITYSYKITDDGCIDAYIVD